MLPVSFDIARIRFRCHFRKSSLFTAICKISHTARYDSAPNHVCKDVDISLKPVISFKHIPHCGIFNPPMFFAVFSVFHQYFLYVLFFRAMWFLFCQFNVLFLIFVTFYVTFLLLCWLFNRHLCC
jgi:hypothetical protein